MDYDGPPEPMPAAAPVREPWLDDDEGPEEDRAQNDVDVRIETKEGRVSICFTVDAVNLPVLEQFIDVDVLNKIADAVQGKMRPMQ